MAGRPIEYNYVELKPLIEEYLEDCEDYTEQELIGMSAKGTELYKNKQYVKIPTIEGLALKLDINKSTLYDWASKYPEFSNDIDKLRAIQADRLLNKGLSGDYNSTIAKVLLTKHGYREGTEHSGVDGKAIVLEETSNIDLAEIAQEAAKILKAKKNGKK